MTAVDHLWFSQNLIDTFLIRYIFNCLHVAFGQYQSLRA